MARNTHENGRIKIIVKMPYERNKNAELFVDPGFKRYAKLGEWRGSTYEVLCIPDRIGEVRAAIARAGLEIIKSRQPKHEVLRRSTNHSEGR